MQNAKHFTYIVDQLRNFFRSKGFIEVPAQSHVTILAACEDPSTVVTTEISGKKWPLPQTGQMRLEDYLLRYPDEAGFFCITTSYRDEPDPIEGRHDKVFPMFEFETHGDMNDLINLEFEAMKHLGFEDDTPKEVDYEKVADELGVDLIGPEEEKEIPELVGSNVVALKNFPRRSQPFWNMRRKPLDSDNYKKVDLIVHGRETIGSAERAIDVGQMKEDFHNIKDGAYKEKLFNEFGEDRVKAELDEYLNHDFIQRCGGGIGVTRLQQGLIDEGVLEA